MKCRSYRSCSRSLCTFLLYSANCWFKRYWSWALLYHFSYVSLLMGKLSPLWSSEYLAVTETGSIQVNHDGPITAFQLFIVPKSKILSSFFCLPLESNSYWNPPDGPSLVLFHRDSWNSIVVRFLNTKYTRISMKIPMAMAIAVLTTNKNTRLRLRYPSLYFSSTKNFHNTESDTALRNEAYTVTYMISWMKYFWL